MRFVIYDEYLEPITVVNVPGLSERDIEGMGRRICLPIQPPIERDIRKQQPCSYVYLTFEMIVRKGTVGWICFAKNEELAMLLAPDWLPGQRAEINHLQDRTKRLEQLLGAILCR